MLFASDFGLESFEPVSKEWGGLYLLVVNGLDNFFYLDEFYQGNGHGKGHLAEVFSVVFGGDGVGEAELGCFQEGSEGNASL